MPRKLTQEIFLVHIFLAKTKLYFIHNFTHCLALMLDQGFIKCKLESKLHSHFLQF